MSLQGTKLTRQQELELPTYQAFLDKGIFWFDDRAGTDYCIELSFGKIYILGNGGKIFQSLGEMSPDNYERALEMVKNLY